MNNELVKYAFQYFDTNPIIQYSTGKRLYPNADGVVWYEVLCEDRTIYLRQLFVKGLNIHGYNDMSIVWSWDGDRENPTLNPSFLWPDGRLHLFVRHGNLDILPDTTVKHDGVKRVEKIDWD